MIYYHYTQLARLQQIMDEGKLRRTESNLDLRPGREHAGPDVVWLTTDETLTPDKVRENLLPNSTVGYHGLQPEKAEVRITVDLPKAHVEPWRLWAVAHGMNPVHMWALANAGGSIKWRVYQAEIPMDKWVAVHLDGTQVWRNQSR